MTAGLEVRKVMSFCFVEKAGLMLLANLGVKKGMASIFWIYVEEGGLTLIAGLEVRKVVSFRFVEKAGLMLLANLEVKKGMASIFWIYVEEGGLTLTAGLEDEESRDLLFCWESRTYAVGQLGSEERHGFYFLDIC